MALSSAKHEAIHDKTGGDLAAIKANFDNGEHLSAINFPAESAIIYQIQRIQDELDYLRTEISSNKDKVSMSLGTSGSTALAGNTALLALGTSGSTALAGDTRLPAFTADDTSVQGTTKSTAITFGNFDATTTNKGTTYAINIIVKETTVVAAGKGAGTTTITKQGKIPLL